MAMAAKAAGGDRDTNYSQQSQLPFRERFPREPLRSTLVWAIEKADEPINKLRCLELLREVARHLCLRLKD
jgi:hypothetical protein